MDHTPHPHTRTMAAALTALATLLCLPAGAFAGSFVEKPVAAPAQPAGGELIVRFKRSADGSERAEARHAVDAALARTLPLGSSYQVLAIDGSVPAAVEELEARPDVVYAHPNYRVEFNAVPNDPKLGELWGLRNTGQTIAGRAGTPGADIAAPAAWDITTGSAAVKVAVIDSGINMYHPDLVPNIARNPGEMGGNKPFNGLDDDGNGKVDDWRGWDFVDADNDPNDFNRGHGTHVAGTIGAKGNNGIGVSGINWNVSLLPLRVGGDTVAPATDKIIDAIAYAHQQGARVANISIGGAYPRGQEPLVYLDAFRAAPNTLFAISAGNSGADSAQGNYYPCNFSFEPNVICVAATDNRDALTDFSNYGPTVQLAAPGKSILSTTPRYLLYEDWDDTGTEWVTGGAPSGWGLSGERKASGQYSATDSPGQNYAANQDNWVALDDVVSTSRIDPFSFQTCFLNYKMLQNVTGNIVFQRFDVEMLSPSVPSWTSMGGQPPMWQGSTIMGNSFQSFNVPLGVWQDVERLKLRFRFVANFGQTSGEGAYVDDIRMWCGSSFGDPPPEYDEKDGTSMAAPHVAGAAALVAAHRPDATAPDIKTALVASAVPVAGLIGKVTSGGRLNVDRALRYPNIEDLTPHVEPPPQTPPQTPPPQQPTLPATAAAAFQPNLRADAKARFAEVRIACPAQQAATCAGTVSGTTMARFTKGGKVTRSRRGKPLTLVRRTFSVPQSTTGAVRLAVPKLARRELTRTRKIKLKLTLSQDGAKPVTWSVTVTLPRNKKR
jgi:subtilisin family serine protease